MITSCFGYGLNKVRPIIQEKEYKKPECEVSLDEVAFYAGMPVGSENKFGKVGKIFSGMFEHEEGEKGRRPVSFPQKNETFKSSLLRGLLGNQVGGQGNSKKEQNKIFRKNCRGILHVVAVAGAFPVNTARTSSGNALEESTRLFKEVDSPPVFE